MVSGSATEPPRVRAAPRLILASASPRRRALLAEYGFRAEVRPTHAEESTATWLTVPELVLLNARRKASVLWRSERDTVILGVDTLVSLDGEALGKPPDLRAAAAMLARLSGRTHQVYSGLSLAWPAQARMVSFVERTEVHFLPLGAGGIAHYLSLIDPLDKAGGYAAQEHGEKIIASVEGSWTNVLGLPMETLCRVLETQFGIVSANSAAAPLAP